MPFTIKTHKIITPRLVIRCYKPADAAMLKKSIDESIEHLRPWLPWIKFEPETLEAKTERLIQMKAKFENNEDYTFGIFNATETEVIGGTGLHTRLEDTAREIGYWININHVRKGYVTETVNALIKVAFEIENLQRLEIHCDALNSASAAVPPKCGFGLKEIRYGHLKDINGNARDAMIWELTKEHYRRLKNTIEIKGFNKAGRSISI